MRDILLNEQYDIQFAGGDIAIGNAESQNVAVLLKVCKGNIPQFPQMGVGIDAALHSEKTTYWQQIITEQLEADGIRVRGVECQNGRFAVKKIKN